MRLGNLDSTPLLKAFRRLSYFDHVAKILQTAQNNSVKAPVEVAKCHAGQERKIALCQSSCGSRTCNQCYL